jgi:hypothetical protein
MSHQLKPSRIPSTNFRRQFAVTLFVSIVCCGCAEPPEQADSGIMNKKTQEVGEFDPEGEAKVADLQVKPSANPYASAGAYGFAISEISKLTIKQSLNFFKAEHGRMPKDHEEFMTQIIKKNNIQLPVLPGGRQYQYDVENAELVVVEAEKEKTETKE